MNIVGKLCYYASGWTANTCIDIYQKDDKYIIKLGPLNDIKKYAADIEGLKLELKKHYIKDKKFHIKSIEITENNRPKDDTFEKQIEQDKLSQQQEDEINLKEKQKQAKKEKDQEDIDSATESIKNQRAKQAEKLSKVTGNFIQKCLKIYFISLIGFVKNFFMMIMKSISGAFSTGSKTDIIMNKYFFAMVKDSFIVLPPLIILNLIFNPFNLQTADSNEAVIVKNENAYEAGLLSKSEFNIWKEDCTTSSSGVKKLIKITGSKDEGLAWCKATKFMTDIEFFIAQDIDIKDARKWVALDITNSRIEKFRKLDYTPEFIKRNNLQNISPGDIYSFKNKYSKTLDEAIKLISIFKSSSNYRYMLEAFKGNEEDLLKFVNDTSVSDFKIYRNIIQAQIRDKADIKAWNELFINNQHLANSNKKQLFLMMHFKNIANLNKFNAEQGITLQKDQKSLYIVSGFFQTKINDIFLAKYLFLLKKYDLYANNNSKARKIFGYASKKNIDLESMDYLLSHGFNYIFEKKYESKMRNYIRKHGIKDILLKLKAGNTPKETYLSLTN